MPKIKIKDWKGLYTNIDENDVKLEYARDTYNFKHHRGVLEYEPMDLIEETLPDLTIFSESSGFDFEWETGIYCTLANDPLSQNPVAATYNIKFLIAKAWDAGLSQWHRLLYAQINNVWHELSSDGDYSDLVNSTTAGTDFSTSYFSTSIDGRPIFKVAGGRLKIYLPHAAFWFGRIERTYYGDHQWGANYSLDTFRLEKLIDGLSVVNQDVNVSVGFAPIADGGVIYLNERPVISHYEHTAKYGSNLTALGDKHYFEVYTFRYADTNEIIPNPIQLDANNYHYFPTFTDNAGFTAFLVQEEYNSLFKINGDTLNTLYGPVQNIVTTGLYDAPYPDGWYSSATMNYYAVSRTLGGSSPFFDYQTQNEDCTWLQDGGTTATLGFETTVTKMWIIITAVWDEREETIVTFTPFEYAPPDKWALQLTDLRPVSATGKRLTRLRVYAKVNDGVMADFELVRDIEYLNADALDNSIIYIYPDVFTGITLNSNIGFLVDEKKMATSTDRDYKILESFRSITTISDLTFGVLSTDHASIYYSTIGGGNLMPDLLYSISQYQMNNITTVNATANINEKFGIFTDNTLYLVEVIDELGVFTFSIKGTLEFGVKDQRDVAEMQGGVLIHTQHGIYTTTGYQSNLISEPIDDTIQTYYSTGSILYNKYKHEIIYTTNTDEEIYRFRFKDQVWEKLNKAL